MDKAEENSQEKDKQTTVSGVGHDVPRTQNTEMIFESSHRYDIVTYHAGTDDVRYHRSMFILRYIPKSRSILMQ